LARNTELENLGPVTIYVRTEIAQPRNPALLCFTDRGHPAKPYDPIKVDKMTTPDEEITGYGGPARTDANAQSTSAPAQPTGQTGQAGTTQASSSASAPSAEELKAKAREAGEQVKNQGKAQLDSYRGTAADELEKVAQSAKAAAAELENQDRTGLSHYVSDMAQSMVDLADNLRGKSVDELVGEVNRLARNNPGLFIAGSVALGFGLTRFARASSHRAESATREPTTDYGHSDASRPHPTSPLGVPADVTAETLPSQSELDSRISSGAPGSTVGSVSNAGMAPNTGSTNGVGSNGVGSTGKGTNGGLNR